MNTTSCQTMVDFGKKRKILLKKKKIKNKISRIFVDGDYFGYWKREARKNRYNKNYANEILTSGWKKFQEMYG